MDDIHSIYHRGLVNQIFSPEHTAAISEEVTIRCTNYCSYEIHWLFLENQDPTQPGKIQIEAKHLTKYPFDFTVNLIVRFRNDAQLTDMKKFPLSIDPGQKSVHEIKESMTGSDNCQAYNVLSFQLEASNFNYIGSNFGTEVNLEDASRTHDLVISVLDRKFYVMATYLRSWSEWFNAKLEAEKSTEIVFDDLDPDIFLILLKATHPNMHNSGFQSHMSQILNMAVRFKMHRVAHQCAERLIDMKSFPDMSIMDRLEIAEKCRDHRLKKACYDAFDKDPNRNTSILNNKKIVRSMPKSVNLELIMILAKDRGDSVEEIGDDYPKITDDDDIIEIMTPELSFTDQSRRHDRILNLKGKRYFVDSVYLSTWSQYFDTMFFGGFSESNKTGEISLEQENEAVFNLLLQIMYTKDISLITESNVLCLLDMAGFYQIPSIIAMCGTYLMNFCKVPELKVVERLELADAHRHLDFLIFCLNAVESCPDAEKMNVACQLKIKLSASTQRNMYIAMVPKGRH